MRRGRVSLVIALTLGLALPGCLCYQAIETRWTLPRGGHAWGRFSIVYENIGSTDSTTQEQSEDFRELVEDWKGDKYLLERAEKGFDVTERKVWLKHGRVMAEEKGFFRVLSEEDVSFSFDSTGYRMAWKRDDDGNLEFTSNGRITLGDSVVIHWPPGTTEFRTRGIVTGDKTKECNSLEESLRVFLAEEKKQGR